MDMDSASFSAHSNLLNTSGCAGQPRVSQQQECANTKTQTNSSSAIEIVVEVKMVKDYVRTTEECGASNGGDNIAKTGGIIVTLWKLA